MRIPIGYGAFLAAAIGLELSLLVGTVILLGDRPELLATVAVVQILALSALLFLVPIRINCPSCGSRGAARLRFGYHREHGNADKVAPKLDCPSCGLLVRVSDFPVRFEPDG